jgi:hypothetical protein
MQLPLRFARASLGLALLSVFAMDVGAQPLAPRPAGTIPSAPVVPPRARVQDCAHDADHDGDGFRSFSCGGPDCNDDDRYTYPGNAELCDGTLPDGRSAANHDEDCNPATVSGQGSDGDADGDGIPGARCTNPLVGAVPAGLDAWHLRVVGATVIGADCDDNNVAIVPGAMSCVDDTTVRLCLKGGPIAAATAGFKPGDVVTSNDTAFGGLRVKCPSGTRCITQPNGTGICTR